MEKTLRSFPSTGRTGDFSVLLEPHNPVCAQETVTLNSLRGGPAVKILLRGPRVPSAPHPILSPAPPDPAPHPHPGRTASAFPYHSENRSQLQSGGREKVTSIQLPKRPFMVPGVLRTSTPKDMRWFLCVCVLSFLVWQIEVLRNDRRLFMFTSPKSGSRTSLGKAKQVTDHPGRACTLRS